MNIYKALSRTDPQVRKTLGLSKFLDNGGYIFLYIQIYIEYYIYMNTCIYSTMYIRIYI